MKRKNWGRLRFGTLVQINWVDSAGATEHWEWAEDFELRTYAMQSVGYVWSINPKQIALCPHISRDRNQGCGIMVIPWCSVSRVKQIS